MNIEKTTDRFIRTLKLIGTGGLICLMILIIALMFCETQKVAALLFSEDMDGIFGLVTGLFIGFTIGVLVKHFVSEYEIIFETYVLPHIFEKAYMKNEPKHRKKHHPKTPTAPAKPANSKATQAKAAQPQISKSQAPVQQQTPSVDAPVTDNSKDSRAQNIFGILGEFDDSHEIPADEVFSGEDASEHEVLEAPDAEEVVES